LNYPVLKGECFKVLPGAVPGFDLYPISLKSDIGKVLALISAVEMSYG
jgi:hypothetical protein